jgi:hypothetical protein
MLFLFNSDMVVTGGSIMKNKLYFDSINFNGPIEENQTLYKTIPDFQNKQNGIDLVVPENLSSKFGITIAKNGYILLAS